MNKKQIDKRDTQLKAVFEGTELNTSENLSFRIMRQIEVEKSLKRQPTANPSILGSMLSIYGTMYALVIALAIFIYFYFGKSELFSITFYLPAILIVSISSIYWLIICFDENRRMKKMNTKHTSKL